MLKSPTVRLLFGLLVTLGAVAVFSWYALYQLNGLRMLLTNTIDRNRHDSLLLLQIQNDLNMLGLKLRDMTANRSEPVSITAYQDEFGHLRADLEESIQAEVQMAPATRRADQQKRLLDALGHFWITADMVFQAAQAGKESAARELAATQLSAQQSMLAHLVSDFLERNNEAEGRADRKVAAIYNGVERNVYTFLAAALIMIVVTSLYLTYSNRRIFARIEYLSGQRRVLAAKLITFQEEVLRSVSRELHDEFGQILTAVGAMLKRAEYRGLPPDSPLRTELSEVRDITHNTLEKMRSLSQMLHPTVLDDYGLAKAVEWYVGEFERQTGIAATCKILGQPSRVTGQPAIHCYRIIQEALNNAAKHSGTKMAHVDLEFAEDALTLRIRDFGRGLPANRKGMKPGLGLIAMQERAELVHGKLNLSSAPNIGTTVSLTMPLKADSQSTERVLSEALGRPIAAND